MKRQVISVSTIGILAVAFVSACSKADEAATVSSVACDLNAPSASDAEAKLAGCGAKWIDENVAINQVQSIGTHNSYKQAIPEIELAQIRDRNPDAALTLDYSHRTLAEQLDKGARQIELDPYDDPEGGRFKDPLGPRLLAQRGAQARDYDFSMMSAPGIKVLHTSDIDYRSNCRTLIDCLTQIKTWSDAHPSHTPILIMINPKHTAISWQGATPVLEFGKDAFERMEAEIKQVFPLDRIITPDEVKGTHATLREGAMAGGWPKLGKARGRVIFTIDDSPARWAPYAEGHPSLAGRLAFVNASRAPDAPEAAYFTMNEPEQDFTLIEERVKQGFLIRTRADADTREARAGTTARREAALNSGAQFVSTDYMWPDERFGMGYVAVLADGATTHCNPVSAPPGCDLKAE